MIAEITNIDLPGVERVLKDIEMKYKATEHLRETPPTLDPIWQ